MVQEELYVCRFDPLQAEAAESERLQDKFLQAATAQAVRQMSRSTVAFPPEHCPCAGQVSNLKFQRVQAQAFQHWQHRRLRLRCHTFLAARALARWSALTQHRRQLRVFELECWHRSCNRPFRLFVLALADAWRCFAMKHCNSHSCMPLSPTAAASCSSTSRITLLVFLSNTFSWRCVLEPRGHSGPSIECCSDSALRQLVSSRAIQVSSQLDDVSSASGYVTRAAKPLAAGGSGPYVP